MKWSNLFQVQFKACIKNVFSLFFIIIAIIIAICIGISKLSKENDRIILSVVNDDEGEYGKEVLKLLENQNIELEEMEYDKAMKLLKNGTLEAVFYIPKDFTSKIEGGTFENTLNLYKSPSSQSSASVVEPIINATMTLWMKEQAVLLSKDYLNEKGKVLDSEKETEIRSEFNELWENGSNICVKETRIEINKLNEIPLNMISYTTSINWYATFCVFYLIVNAVWVLDINKKGLCIRTAQTGISQWKLLLISGMPSIIICLIGYLCVSILSLIITKVNFILCLIYFLPMIIYLITVLGITLFLAAILKYEFLLMFIAPVITFFNGVLSGLIIELPEWLSVVIKISYILPGRWLQQFDISDIKNIFGSLICCIIWLLIGIASSTVINNFSIRKGEKNG